MSVANREAVLVRSPLETWAGRVSPPGLAHESLGPCDVQGLGAADWPQFAHPEHAVCITLYNEPIDRLFATLRTLVASLCQQVTGGQVPRRDSACICVVVDGLERVDPEVLAFLQRVGYVGPVEALTPGATSHFLSLHPVGEWMPLLPGQRLADLRFIVSLKHSNRGKLHSHALFFAGLCTQLNPDICYQIDAGTLLDREAIGAVVEHLDRCPDVGALATRVGCSLPHAEDGLLLRWQYMDFAIQLAAHWPAEIMSGHLSVLPGQFCAFRWAALAHKDLSILNSGDVNVAPQPVSTVTRYLRGMTPVNAMETIMFLAEDRVIGNEIVLAFGKPWRLDYCQAAVATTDACDSLLELQRQRRRWNNCSYACRLWLLAQWPIFLKRTDRTVSNKLRMSSALLWQLVLAALQATTPASFVCVTFAMWSAVFSNWTRSGPSAVAGHVLSLATFVAFLLWLPLVLWTPDHRAQAYAGIRDSVGIFAFILLIWSSAIALPLLGVLVLFLPITVVAALPILHAPKGRLLQSVRHLPEYVVPVNGLLQLIMWVYSVMHLHDTSWGTKGLLNQVRASVTKSMHIYRVRVVGAWLSTNAALIWIGVSLPGIWGDGLNPIAETVGAVNAVVAVLALGCFALSYWQGLLRSGLRSRAAKLRRVGAAGRS